MGSFALQIRAWVEKTKDDTDKVVRYALASIDQRLVQRSPVGDPSTWKRNPNQPKVFGKVRAKSGWQMGFMSAESSNFSMSGAGYVGGRFRANWQMSIGSPAVGELDAIDEDGSATLAAHAGTLATARAGEVQYIINNLPYAQRLESGWSRQAPLGLVAITVVEWNNIVDAAVNGVRAGTSAEDFSQGFQTYSL
jgi:hypothetical protein